MKTIFAMRISTANAARARARAAATAAAASTAAADHDAARAAYKVASKTWNESIGESRVLAYAAFTVANACALEAGKVYLTAALENSAAEKAAAAADAADAYASFEAALAARDGAKRGGYIAAANTANAAYDAYIAAARAARAD